MRTHHRSQVPTPSFLRDRRVIGGAFFITGLLVYVSLGGGGVSPGPAVRGQPLRSGGFVPTGGGALNPPHGGTLVELIVEGEEQRKLKSLSGSLPTLTLTQRQLCDIELLLNGGFSPLRGFLNEKSYDSVVENLHLDKSEYPNGELWPMPITLDITPSPSFDPSVGDQVALRDEFYNLIAIMTIESKWKPNKLKEAEQVFGTTDQSHPAVDYLMNTAGDTYLGGSLKGLRLPQHFDFNENRFTPRQLRDQVQAAGWSKFVAFQTRNPMHRAHIELTMLAASEENIGVVIHPVVGMTKPGDVDYAVRVRCYRAIVESGRYYKEGGVKLSLLPLAMRMAGPREAMWHALIRKNHGASHFIVGRDHAGCKSSAGKSFYGDYDAQDLVDKYKDEMGIVIKKYPALSYVVSMDKYLPSDRVPSHAETASISGTQFRGMMAEGAPIPAWFSDPEVIKILRQVAPPRDKRGFTVFFTGLSGSGKTTISSALIKKIQSILPTRQMTILDGDVVRTHLTSNLGFSIDDRNTNVRRVGWAASQVTKHGGIAIASTISPFESARKTARSLVSATGGGFLLVHVSTSVKECSKRDVKGLYAKAMRGELDGLTGVSGPYEMPEVAELTIDAGVISVEHSVQYILSWLTANKYIKAGLLGPSYEPEAAQKSLVSAGILTEGKKDSIAALCHSEESPQTTFVLGDSAIIDAEAAKVEGTRVSVTSAEMTNWELWNSKMSAGKPGTASASNNFDRYFRTGTPLTTVSNVTGLSDVAWSVHAKVVLPKKAGDKLVVTGPRLVTYLPTLLRLNPCAKAFVLDTGARDKEAAAHAAALGSTVSESKQYLDGFYAALHGYVDEFPCRVFAGATVAEAKASMAGQRSSAKC